MTRCTTCGDGDALLFTCSRCEREFCADHGLPYHACEGFAGSPLGEIGRDPETDERSTEGAADTAGRSVSGVEPIARDAARGHRPDREGPTPRPDGRGWPKDRHDDRSVAEWMRAQSYAGYLAKVGSLSLLFTLAFYGGLVAVVLA